MWVNIEKIRELINQRLQFATEDYEDDRKRNRNAGSRKRNAGMPSSRRKPMRSYNPTYGLWNEGEDEVKSSKKYGARALDTSVEEAGRAKRVYSDVSSICRWEHGENITWYKFLEIAHILGYMGKAVQNNVR